MTIFPFVQLIAVLIILAVIWYFLEPYIKDPFRTIIVVVVVLAFCIWLLGLVGLLPTAYYQHR